MLLTEAEFKSREYYIAIAIIGAVFVVLSPIHSVVI